jgi:hypothetical protein
VLADTSASAWRTRSGYAEWLRAEVAEEAERARAGGAELALVRSGRAEVVYGPARPDGAAGHALDPAAEGGDLATELAAAVAAAERLLDGRPSGRLVLLGDGTFTGADPLPSLARLAASGVELAAERAPEPDRVDFAVAALRVPRELEIGAPLAVEVAIEARGAPSPGARTELELELAEPGRGPRVVSQTLELQGASAVARLELGAARAGRTEVRARLRHGDPGGGGDAAAENDAASAVVDVAGALVAAALLPTDLAPPARADWERWLAGFEQLGGIQVLRMAPGDFAASPARAEVAISCGVPIAAGQDLGLAGFAAAGGGWLALGARGLLNGLDEGRAGLSPLLLAEGPARRVLFLADGSGSMAGAPFDELARAVLGALEAAPRTERFELAVFSDRIESRHALGWGGDATAAAEQLLSVRPPHGPTDFAAVLRELLESGALPDLVLLVSDGRDQDPGPVAAAASDLRAALAARGGRLAVIGVGASDRALLELVAGEGELHLGADLARALEDEVELGRVAPRGDYAVSARDPSSLDPAGVAAELARALGAIPLPSVERAARAELAPGAEAVLDAADLGPLLAVRRVGRGHVAAFASAPVAGSAGAWAPRAELFGPVLRAIARRGPRERPVLALAEGPEGPRWRLSGVPADWPAVLTARSGSNELLLATPPELPGADPAGQRWGRDPVPAELASPLRVDLFPGPSVDGGADLLATLPGPPEGGELAARPRRLGPLPRSPGGDRRAGWTPSGPTPFAHLWMALGVALLAAAALAWDRGRAGPPGDAASGR